LPIIGVEDSKMTREKDGSGIRIKNISGIPIVEIAGELNKTAIKAVESTIITLAAAGHYHIVINIKKLASVNAKLFGNLRGSAGKVMKHYGAIDVVADSSQINQFLSLRSLARAFRFCTSEAEALCRIKKLARRPDPGEQGCSAHISEAK
jgi:anti-sigma B factor antagonist